MLLFIIMAIVETTQLSIKPFHLKPLYGTKTYYQWLDNELGEINENDFIYTKNSASSNVANSQSGPRAECSPVFVNVMQRHGARFPSYSNIIRILDVHKKILDNSAFLSKKYDNIKLWKNPFLIEDEKQLSIVGIAEQYALGKRYGMRFSDLLHNYGECAFKSMCTEKQRTMDSGLAFHQGLFDGLAEKGKAALDADLCYHPSVNSSLLRFFDECEKYQVEVENNHETMREFNEFKKSPHMNKMVRKVSHRLLGSANTFTADEVHIMFITCAFEQGLFNESVWCPVFEKEEELRVFEYLSDIEDYWEKYIGYNITYQQSCPLVSHIFQHIDDAIRSHKDGERYIHGYFQFAHAETLFPVLAALGLFSSDHPLRADNYEQHRNRLFRTSRLFPFSANLAFVLYHCPTLQDYFLKIFVNERPVELPACDGALCLYKTVRHSMRWYVDECDFDALCSTRTKEEL